MLPLIFPLTLILGNHLAGGKVLINPEVTAVPLSEHPEELEQTVREIIPVCTVTCAVSEKQKQDLLNNSDIAFADSFMTAEEDINFLLILIPWLFQQTQLLPPLWLRT